MAISCRSNRLSSHLSSYFYGCFMAAYLTLAMAILALITPGVVAEESITVKRNADIRVLIDVSGSMKQNDPRNLRRPAMDLLVQLFPVESRAGIWTFGKYVNMLVPHDTVTTDWREQSAQKSRLVNSVALHTNIGLALEKAIYDDGQKKYSDTADFNTSVILLTDGVVDIAKDPEANELERQRIFQALLPRYQAAGIAIHAVALSTNADVDLLEHLAIETGGIFAVAEDAEDLNRIFLRAFDQSSPSDRAPLNNNRFLIDSSVEEFTALVFKQSGSDATKIQSPNGEVFSADSEGASLRWFASDAYDLITVQQPMEGEWTINAAIDPDNRVTVVSDLILAIEPIANNLYRGDKAALKASVLEGGKVISRDEFLDLFTVTASLSQENKEFWQQLLVRGNNSAGIYTHQLDTQELDLLDEYALHVIVDGKTFKREKTLNFTVREPFKVELTVNESEGEYSLSVIANDKRMHTDKIVLSANIVSPDGSELNVELDSQKVGEWSYQVKEQSSGQYVIRLSAIGENTGADKINYELDEQALSLNVPDAPETPVSVDIKASEPIEDALVVVDAEVIDESPKLEQDNRWLPIIALIGGNLLLIGLLFFIYKKMIANNSSASSADEDEDEKEKEDKVVDDEPSNAPPLVKEAYEEAKEEASIVDQKIVDRDAVDISVDVDEVSTPAANAVEPETIVDEDDVDLDTLLDIDDKVEAPADDKEADAHEDDVEFDLGADDDTDAEVNGDDKDNNDREDKEK
ncbi:VWA domain-containing protein [Pseudomonadales bacterium]|nr:VWA domain-containing protein [Pseudomonadales bacterium]